MKAGVNSRGGSHGSLHPNTERLAEACGVQCSVGSKGDSYDKRGAESVLGLLKAELIYNKGPWTDIEDVEFGSLDGRLVE